MTSPTPFRLGTRGSPLALAQAHEVRDRLAAAHDALAMDGAIEIVVIQTTGDRVTDRPLAEIGGKGLFTQEIEAALIEGSIDAAVHSMKDVPTWLPEGLAIACLLPREDPRDALLTRDGGGGGIAGLPEGAVVGTASLRRQAQLLALRPDLEVVNFRGNVQTRMKKLADGKVDATLLARAGLNRLGLGDRGLALAPEEMLPAVAQGAIGLEARIGDAATGDILAAIDDAATATRVAAERAVLAALNGSCHTPVAVFSELEAGGAMRLRALVAAPEGDAVRRAERRGPAADAAAMAADLAAELMAAAGPELCARIGIGGG